MPRALRVAIPYTYDDALFEDATGKRGSNDAAQQQQQEPPAQNNQQSLEEQAQALEEARLLLDHGRNVKVVGVAPNPAKQGTYIDAATTAKRSTGQDKPDAVCLDGKTTIT